MSCNRSVPAFAPESLSRATLASVTFGNPSGCNKSMRLDHGQRVARERPPFDLASDQLIKTISAHADFTSLVSEDGELRESDTCSSLALLTTPPARLAQRMRRRGARTRRVVYRSPLPKCQFGHFGQFRSNLGPVSVRLFPPMGFTLVSVGARAVSFGAGLSLQPVKPESS